MSKKEHTIVKTASIITLITLVSKVFGFLREAIIAYYFGTSSEVDMYLMAISIPTIVLGFITCIGTALTPVYAEISVNEGTKKSLGFLTQLIFCVSVICGFIIVIVWINADFVTRIVAPGFNSEMISITAGYLRISLWNLLVTTIMNIFVCYLNSNGKYMYASISMLFHSSVQIVFTFLAHYIGPIFLTVGYLISNICYFLALIFFSIKYGFKLAKPYHEQKYYKMLLKLFVPIGISSMVTQVNGYVDKYFATGLPIGSISALHYANIIRTFVIMMLNTGLITMFFPIMSRYVAEKRFDKVKNTLISSIRYVIIVFLPTTFLLIIFADVVTEILFQRGQFDIQSVDLTVEGIKMYAIGITAVALRDIFLNYLYSIKNSMFTLIVSIASVFINIFLNILFVDKLGIGGLALATSLSAIITIPIFWTRIQKELDFSKDNLCFGKFLIKCFVANLLLLLLFMIFKEEISSLNILCSILAGGSYILLYFLVLKLLKVEEVDIILNIGKKFLLNKVKWRR